jgi:hypothetical protein
MRSIVRGLLVGAFVLGAAHGSFAKCGDDPGDAAKVQAAREAAAASCDCASFTNHGLYVKCVKDVAEAQANLPPPNNLPVQCKSAVKKCAAHSVCGKPGFVTCCITTPKGTKCKTKKDEAHCTAKGGTVTGSATTGCSSCCDACTNPSGPSCVSSPSGAFLN